MPPEDPDISEERTERLREFTETYIRKYRSSVEEAADAVERWALGNEDEDFAMNALEIAQEAISRAMERSDDGNDG